MESALTSTYRSWLKLPRNALGSALFSVGMCVRVPFFATVLPRVTELEPGRCEVRAPKWWGVHNHLGTFHAIAACNLAEAAMGMLAEATVPSTHRWIPKAMSTQYLAKQNPVFARWPNSARSRTSHQFPKVWNWLSRCVSTTLPEPRSCTRTSRSG